LKTTEKKYQIIFSEGKVDSTENKTIKRGKGYHFDKNKNKYVARGYKDGKTIHLGVYFKEEDAIKEVEKFRLQFYQ
jgi:hypothetical protein